MKPLKFKISISVEIYDEKTAENDQNYYVAEKRIVFKLSKISVSNFDSTNSRPFLLYFLRKKFYKERYGRVGPVHRFK